MKLKLGYRANDVTAGGGVTLVGGIVWAELRVVPLHGFICFSLWWFRGIFCILLLLCSTYLAFCTYRAVNCCCFVYTHPVL